MLKPHDKHDNAVIKRGGRKHDEEAHGGAWKVAFADFCLALLSLFLVLWLMAAREQQNLKEIMLESSGSKTDQGKGVMPETLGGPRGSMIERFPTQHNGMGPGTSEAERQADAAAAPKVRYESAADLAALSKALEAMSAELGLSANLEAVVTPYGLRVMVHDTERQGMFVRGSSVPTDKFAKLLRKMGPLFARMENQMLIVGHTDSVQYANTDTAAYSNWTLSSNRAMAARAHLLAGSMNPDSVLQVVGMADRAPLDQKRPAAGVNRRIELLVLTRDQAHSIAAMFGVAAERRAEAGEIDTALPDVSALKQLRDTIFSTKRKPAPAPAAPAE